MTGWYYKVAIFFHFSLMYMRETEYYASTLTCSTFLIFLLVEDFLQHSFIIDPIIKNTTNSARGLKNIIRTINGNDIPLQSSFIKLLQCTILLFIHIPSVIFGGVKHHL